MSEKSNHSAEVRAAIDRVNPGTTDSCGLPPTLKSEAQLHEELRILGPILRAQREAVGRATRAMIEQETALAFAHRAYDETIMLVNLIRADLGLEEVQEIDDYLLRLDARAAIAQDEMAAGAREDEHAENPGCA